MVEDNRRITINATFGEVLKINPKSVHIILTEDLAVQQMSAKFVLKLLVEQQKQFCMKIAKDLFECAKSYCDFMKTIITGDET